MEDAEFLSVGEWEGPYAVEALRDLLLGVLVLEATKLGLATQVLPTVLKSDRSPLSANIYWAENKEEKYKETSHSKKKRRHLHGKPQGQVSKRNTVEVVYQACTQTYQS